MTFADKNIRTYSYKELQELNEVPERFLDVAKTMLKCIEGYEYKSTKSQWVVTGANQILLGSIDVNPKSMNSPHLDSFGYFTISLRISTNTKYALSFLSGARIDVTDDNSYFCPGEEYEKRRQTSNIHLLDACEQAIHKFTLFSENAQMMVNLLKAKKITAIDEGYGLITFAAASKLMPFRNIEYVCKEWDALWAVKFMGSDKSISAWDLWNCFEVSWTKLGACDRYDFFKGIYPLFSTKFQLPRIK
jgi:hypothetical protein